MRGNRMLTTSKWIYEDLTHGLSTFGTMAFDGRFFYFADAENIYIYSKNFEPLNCIKSAIKIAAMCYDSSDDCFWASNGKTDEIIKLNRRFEKTGQLTSGEAVYGLSYFCAHDTLLACTHSAVIEICKHGEKRIIHTAPKASNAASAAPFFALLQDRNSEQIIRFYAPSELHATLEAPPGYAIADILFYPPENQIIALANSGKKVKILRHPMPCIDICCCNYSFDSCNEYCKWLLANTNCNSNWKAGLM